MSIPRKSLIFTLVCLHGIPLALGGEKEPQAVKVAWETDYGRAMDLANRQQKMLVIFFHNPSDPQSQRLQTETLENADVQQKLLDFVCLRLPLDAKATADDKEIVLLQHSSLSEMLGRPGVAIADFAHADPKLHGCIVSVFPLTGSLFYGPAQMQVILDLPPGSLTQRNLIYAVRIHPEKPASALAVRMTACWPRQKAHRNTRRAFASKAITAGMRDFRGSRPWSADCRGKSVPKVGQGSAWWNRPSSVFAAGGSLPATGARSRPAIGPSATT